MNLEGCAEIEVSSEDRMHPIEGALLPGNGGGWRAAAPGKQTIRVVFDAAQTVRRMRLVFLEEHRERTQEFVLRYTTTADGGTPREILRQQYNFSPIASEVEDYAVNLEGVKSVELEINPAINGDSVPASLAEWRIG